MTATPPIHTINTVITLSTITMSGWFHAESRIAPRLSSRSSRFFASNLAISNSSRAKALTTRTPLRLSCITVPSAPVSFCTLCHIGRQRRAQQSEWNEIAHRLDIDREARHQLPGFGFVMERETQALQVIVDAIT